MLQKKISTPYFFNKRLLYILLFIISMKVQEVWHQKVFYKFYFLLFFSYYLTYNGDLFYSHTVYFSFRASLSLNPLLNIFQTFSLQESAAVQMLLETCLETPEDKVRPGRQWALQEVRSLVCSYLHQAFIADTTLCKLVHFQVRANRRLRNDCFPNLMFPFRLIPANCWRS